MFPRRDGSYGYSTLRRMMTDGNSVLKNPSPLARMVTEHSPFGSPIVHVEETYASPRRDQEELDSIAKDEDSDGRTRHLMPEATRRRRQSTDSTNAPLEKPIETVQQAPRRRRDSRDSTDGKELYNAPSRRATESPSPAPKVIDPMEPFLPDSNPTIDHHPAKRRMTLNVAQSSPEEIETALKDKDKAITAEALATQVESHPGFRIQIFYSDWESTARTIQELVDKVAQDPIHWFYAITQLQEIAFNQSSHIDETQKQLNKAQASYNRLHAEVIDLREQALEHEVSLREMTEQVAPFTQTQEDLTHAQDDLKRVRSLRDMYKNQLAQADDNFAKVKAKKCDWKKKFVN